MAKCEISSSVNRESIFKNMEYCPVSKIIYAPCDIEPKGIVKNGKITWFK